MCKLDGMLIQTVRADEVRSGDYLTHGFDADHRPRWSRVTSARTLKNGRVSIRLASGAWGSTMRGTYQNIVRHDADDMVEVAR